jgi:hypothetical protein
MIVRCLSRHKNQGTAQRKWTNFPPNCCLRQLDADVSNNPSNMYNIYIYHIVIPFSMLDCGLVQCWRQALRSSGVFFLHHLWVRPMGFFMGAEGAQRDILRPASNSRRSHCQPNIFPLDPQTSSDTPWTPERDAHKAQTSWKNTTAFTF